MGLFYQAQGDLESAISHYRDAIAIARIIGNKRFEGIYLGNLGDSLFRWADSKPKSFFERPSLLVTRPFPWRLAPSELFGLALGEQGRLDEARELLAVGESQVEAQPDEYAKFLCKKGQVCFIVGDADGARGALQQAKSMADELQVGEDSEVGHAVSELGSLLNAHTPPGGNADVVG